MCAFYLFADLYVGLARQIGSNSGHKIVLQPTRFPMITPNSQTPACKPCKEVRKALIHKHTTPVILSKQSGQVAVCRRVGILDSF
jgi:hypothetical protein